jgi:hypothetical protein
MTRARPRPILWFQPPPGSLLAALLLLCLNLLGPLPAWGQEEGDPPGRVGRIAQREGPVRWFDQEEQRWDDAQLNLPLTQGDRVVTEAGGRAELRIGSTLLIVDEASELAFDRLDDDELRVRVLRGRVALRLRSDEIAREVAFGSDDAWLRPLRAGLYGLQREGAMTEATSWRGQLQLDDGSRLIVDAGRRVQLWRADSELRLRLAAIEDDAFASRVRAADRDEERAAAATRHVSPEMTGWEDLGRYGRWDQHPEYGAVWAPTAVAVDWAPYRDGRWVWLRPWGWTWVDAAPWGFAPFHYGRWMRWHARWVWVPGPVVARPVFAPALVAWIDAPAVGIGIRLGNVSFSWMPLAPWEPYRPAYHASPRYFTRVDPPEWRRHRPPPGWQGGIHYGRDGLPHGVTVVPADVLRRPPPHGAHRADPPRPLLPGRPHERPPRFGEPDRGHGHGDERGFDGGPQRPPRADERAPERRLPPIGGPQEAPVLIHPPVMSGPGARVPRVHRDEPESALRPGGGREPARPVQPVQPVQPESPRAPQAPIFTPAPSEGRQRIPERASPQPRRLPPEVESRSRDDEVPQRPERRGSVR